jgi:glucan phosphoethanolaminetransferase (alkaline phosphatase superfamily)
MYALATTLFAAANVFITYRLSLGQHVGSWLALAAGVLQVIGIVLFHRSLQEVVVVQIIIMSGLVLVMTLYELVIQRREMAHATAKTA